MDEQAFDPANFRCLSAAQVRRLKMSAENGVRDAEFQLGWLNLTGAQHGIERNPAQAGIWLLRASQHGLEAASYWLAHLSAFGDHNGKDKAYPCDPDLARKLCEALLSKVDSVFRDQARDLLLVVTYGRLPEEELVRLSLADDRPRTTLLTDACVL